MPRKYRYRPVVMGMKVCIECDNAKPLSEFYRDRTRRGGYSYRCRLCARARGRRSYRAMTAERRKERIRRHTLARHGLTEAIYRVLVEGQEGRCAICERERKLMVDHDHQSGRVRGLLCRNCNTGIGQFDDSPERVLSALAYLHTGPLPIGRGA